MKVEWAWYIGPRARRALYGAQVATNGKPAAANDGQYLELNGPSQNQAAYKLAESKGT